MKAFLFTLVLALCFGVPRLFAAGSCQKTYRLKVHSGVEVILDGRLKEPVWQRVPAEESFDFHIPSSFGSLTVADKMEK